MIRTIRPIKKETRTLGLDTCNPGPTIGAISRGANYLDGIISFPPATKNSSRELSRRIVESAYFPELRAIMLHNPNGDLNTSIMERTTKLPTMAISETKPRQDRGYRSFQGELGRLWVKTRLESTIFTKILAATWATGELPEPLRVAHLLASLDLPENSG